MLRFLTLGLTVMVVAGGLWLTGPWNAQAQTATTFSVESIGSKVGLPNTDLVGVVFRVINWALGILTFAGLVFVMYGGFLWLTAAGNEKQIEKAKRVILQACIGLVIVLLAWAIVLFVVRFFKSATSNNSNNNTNSSVPCLPGSPDCPLTSTTFNVTTIATCAAPTDYRVNVPRASNVAVFFNNPIDQATTKQAVIETQPANFPKLMVNRCGTDAANDPNCAIQNASAAPVNSQIFSPNRSVATETNPGSEWVVKQRSNAITYIHKSFDTTAAGPKNQLFEAQRTYRIQLPKGGDTPGSGAVNALQDATPQQRKLRHCQSELGGLIDGCVEDDTANILHWTFTTGQDIEGPPFSVAKTVPVSTYKYPTPVPDPVPVPDRDVDRDGTICIYFNSALDPTSVDPSTFTVTKFQTGQSPTGPDYSNGQLEATPLPTANFSEPYFVKGGTGVCIKPLPEQEYDAFSWYKVNVAGVRNLCGTEMNPTNYDWVFQSNDRLPGVEKVYPKDGFPNACPATKVKVVFRTSMWTGQGSDCSVGGGSYVTGGTLRSSGVDSGRAFGVVDQWDPANPNKNCRVFEFTPTTTQLTPGQTYNGTVLTNRLIKAGDPPLEVGTPNSGHPWSFTVGPADSCVNAPIITKVSPTIGKNGQCVTVIGDYFENPKKSAALAGKPGPGDALTLGGRDQLTDPDVAWNNRSIVTVVDAGTLTRDQKQPYRVTVHYDAPIGDLSDEALDLFTLQSGDGSTGPCLLNLSKTSGPPLTTFDANGKRFADRTAASTVDYSPALPAGLLSYASWTDRRVAAAKIPADTLPTTSDVTISNANGESNGIEFETTPVPPIIPGAPRVDISTSCDLNADPQEIPSPSPRDGATGVCLTVRPEARFTVPMLAASLNTTNIRLEDCTSTPCTPVTILPPTVDGDLKGISIVPPRLTPSRTYRVTISADVQGAAAPNVRMGRDFTWDFTTKSDTSDCPIAGISIRERSTSFQTEPFSYNLSSSLRSNDCQDVGGSCSDYAWTSSKPTVATLSSSNAATTTANSADPISIGATKVQVQCQTKKSSAISITYDPTACTDNSQCQVTNRFGESCTTASTCVAGRCTPVITRFVPADGAPGTWASIHGCWFGGYTDGASKVVFGADQGAQAREAANFDPLVCDNQASWQNDLVIREVPTGAVTGRVQVVRDASAETTSADNFTVNATIRPGICKVVPKKGTTAPATSISIVGKNFGTRTAPNPNWPATESDINARDAGLMTLGTDDTRRYAMTLYPHWNDTDIGSSVPSGSAIGANLVQVRRDGVTSNDVPFTVQDPSTVNCTACVNDASACASVGGVAYGCSATTHCCAPRPTIIDKNPGQNTSGMCTNVAPQLTFNQPLDESTVTDESIQYMEDALTVHAKVNVKNTANTGVISMNPGLLQAGSWQDIQLRTATVTGTNVLANSSFEDVTGTTPNGWVATNAKSSTEHPAAVSGKSGLSDCSGTCPGGQAWLTQTIGTPSGGLWPAGTMFRLRGWVRTEQPNTVASGLITQCADAGNRLMPCGFDLGAIAPGLFTGNSGGWREIITYAKTSVPAKLHVNCFARAGAKTWCDNVVVEQLTSGPTSIRGKNGVLVDTAGTPYRFQAGTNICALDRIRIVPSQASWDSATSSTVFWGQALAANGTALSQVASYAWDWEWLTTDTKVATVTHIDDPTLGSFATGVSGGNPGTAYLVAKAKVTTNAADPNTKPTKKAQAKITADFCVNPWTFADSGTNCDVNGGGCVGYNFQLSYCRGNTTDATKLLPDFSYMGQGVVVNAVSDKGAIEGANASLGRLKSAFFKTSAEETDAIGVLVYPNISFLTPTDWFNARFPAKAGNGVATTIGGFPALKVGTTLYVGVANRTSTKLEGLMFVFDFNSNQAESATKAVFEKMMQSVVFNIDLDDDAQRGQIQRDTKRLQDLNAIASALTKYKTTNGSFPALDAGSYKVGISTSRWPSWQATLGKALATTIPVDPNNTFARTCSGDPALRCTNNEQCVGAGTCGASTVCAPPYENATCWAESTKQLVVPNQSSVYMYQRTTGGYKLCAQMEYTGVGTFRNAAPNAGCETANSTPISGTVADCSCFNYQTGI